MQLTIDAPTATVFVLSFVLALAVLTATGGSLLVAVALAAGAVGSIPGWLLMDRMDVA